MVAGEHAPSSFSFPTLTPAVQRTVVLVRDILYHSIMYNAHLLGRAITIFAVARMRLFVGERASRPHQIC